MELGAGTQLELSWKLEGAAKEGEGGRGGMYVAYQLIGSSDLLRLIALSFIHSAATMLAAWISVVAT